MHQGMVAGIVDHVNLSTIVKSNIALCSLEKKNYEGKHVAYFHKSDRWQLVTVEAKEDSGGEV